MLLRRFVGHQEEALGRLKRGGGVVIQPFDESGHNLDSVFADPKSLDPEKVFEQVWVTDVLNRALDQVRQRCLSGPRAIAFRVYEAYDMVPTTERSTSRSTGWSDASGIGRSGPRERSWIGRQN